jgi:polyhydroxyalkanoate synthesis regulator phasin
MGKEKQPEMTVEEARQYMDSVMTKFKEKEQKKMDKAMTKLDKKLQNVADNNVKVINEMLESGKIQKEDLIKYNYKVKKFSDIVDIYGNDAPVEEDIVEEEPEVIIPGASPSLNDIVQPFGGNIIRDQQSVDIPVDVVQEETTPIFNDMGFADNIIRGESLEQTPAPEQQPQQPVQPTPQPQQAQPAFTMGYQFDEEGNIVNITSSDANPNPIPNNDIINRIIADEDLKAIYPSVTRNSIVIQNGIITLLIPRVDAVDSENSYTEIFRIDYIGNQLYVQAPLTGPVESKDGTMVYNFVSVPMCSDIGKEILTSQNKSVDLEEVDLDTALFRDNEFAA